jgi:pimeloyl-ACP methyl ester carboxylesterase
VRKIQRDFEVISKINKKGHFMLHTTPKTDAIDVNQAFSNSMGEGSAEDMGHVHETSRFGKMIEYATAIPRVVFSILLDISLLPLAAIALFSACCKVNLNPRLKDLKIGKTPILLLHGSGFNESEWIIGRLFLKNELYGSVFSLNYDGLIGNDPHKGIDDYARDKIRVEIKRITDLVGAESVILIGHSLGGMIAGYYAEYFAKKDQIHIKHVISIASPWLGSPILDLMWRYSNIRRTKRHMQMSISGGTEDFPKFRESLVNEALKSEQECQRKYYNICSTTDWAVPGQQGLLTNNPMRQRSFNYLGHYALVAYPPVWLQIRLWLNAAYAADQPKLWGHCSTKSSSKSSL